MLSYLRNLTAPQYPAIGIDCGSRMLKAIQVRPVQGGMEAVAAASVPVPAGAANDFASLAAFFRGPVRRLLADNGFRGRRVSLSVPAGHMHAASVRRPKGDIASDAALGWHPFPASEALVRTVDAGEVTHNGRRCREIVSLAVRRDVVSRYTRAAAAAGLEVTGVSSEPEAILGALAFQGPDSRLLRLVVDLGLSSTRVYAAAGRRLFFARCLRTGGAALEGTLATALGVGREDTCALRSQLPALDRAAVLEDGRLRRIDEACGEPIGRLVEELRRSHLYISSTFTGIPVHHIVFVGGGARHRRLWQRIASGVGLPARAADPVSRLVPGRAATTVTSSALAAAPGFVVCCGLAIDAANATTAGQSDACPVTFDDRALAPMAAHA